MTRHVLTKKEMTKGMRAFAEGRESAKARRRYEKALLNRVLAELVMPEWYPER